MAAAAAVAALRPLAATSSSEADRGAHRRRRPLSLASKHGLSLAAPLAAAGTANALALPKEDIVSSLTKVEEAVDQATDVGSRVLEFSLNVIKALSDAVKPGIDAAVPVLRGVSEEALKVASPVLTDASEQAKEALQSAGVDPTLVLSAAKIVAGAAQQSSKVLEVAKPVASAAFQTIASAGASSVLVSAGAAFAVYVLFPPIWSAVSLSFRGYKGDLSAAQCLDALVAQNYLLIDIRPEKDKNRAGVPVIPSKSKNRLISLPLEELPNKIKALVKNSKKVEAEVAALKVSYLKKVGKGSNIIIMDSYSDAAKIVARTLTSLGFKNVFVMADGFSGRAGWSQSRLGTESYSSSVVEVLSPSRVIPAATARFNSEKLLPGSIES